MIEETLESTGFDTRESVPGTDGLLLVCTSKIAVPCTVRDAFGKFPKLRQSGSLYANGFPFPAVYAKTVDDSVLAATRTSTC